MGKASFSPVNHATKTYRRMEAQFHTTSALDRGEWSVSHPCRFTPGEMAHGTDCSNAGWNTE